MFRLSASVPAFREYYGIDTGVVFSYRIRFFLFNNLRRLYHLKNIDVSSSNKQRCFTIFVFRKNVRIEYNHCTYLYLLVAIWPICVSRYELYHCVAEFFFRIFFAESSYSR